MCASASRLCFARANNSTLQYRIHVAFSSLVILIVLPRATPRRFGCEMLFQAGYRDGITVGKERALQGGFDIGFADFGAPLGREIGEMRGIVASLLALLRSSHASTSTPTSTSVSSLASGGGGASKLRYTMVDAMSEDDREALRREIGALGTRLGMLGLQDVAPPDEEALVHAREHASAPSEDKDDGRDGKESNLEVGFEPESRRKGLGALDAESENSRARHARGVRELSEVKSGLERVLGRLGLSVVLGMGPLVDTTDQIGVDRPPSQGKMRL